MLVHALLGGVIYGCYFTLIGLGLNLVFGVMRIVNLAHGDVLMLGAFAAFFLFHLVGLSPFIAAPVVMVGFFLLGLPFYYLVVPRLALAKDAEMLSLILFFGIQQIIEALAAIVFGDAGALEALNGITHPAIGAELFRLKEEHAGSGRVVVIEIPLLTAAHRVTLGLAAVVVVDVDPAVALSRLVDQRGMDPDDAAARMAAQMDRSAHLALADLVVDNSGDRSHLEAEIDRLWAELSVLESVARRGARSVPAPPG